MGSRLASRALEQKLWPFHWQRPQEQDTSSKTEETALGPSQHVDTRPQWIRKEASELSLKRGLMRPSYPIRSLSRTAYKVPCEEVLGESLASVQGWGSKIIMALRNQDKQIKATAQALEGAEEQARQAKCSWPVDYFHRSFSGVPGADVAEFLRSLGIRQ